MAPSNQHIAGVLEEIAAYLEMDEVAFKPRAYEKVAEAIRGMGEHVADAYREGGIKALEAIPGVGTSIAEVIEELLKKGHSHVHDALKKKVPVNLRELLQVQGLGPKKIKALYKKLGVRDLASLEKAAKAGKIRGIPGFGKTSEENLLKGVAFVRQTGGRFLRGAVFHEVAAIRDALARLKAVKKIDIGGSIRRGKETVGDADLLAVSERPGEVMRAFTSLPSVARILAEGETKSAIQLQDGLTVDLRVVPAESYGAALQYFTGSKDHNVELRKMAIAKGMKLNEYGLFAVRAGKEKFVAGKSEEEVYRALGLAYIEPELREMTGEMEVSRAGRSPKLVETEDLCGDLQTQTQWSDGAKSIPELAEAALASGLEYIAITDHTKSLKVTGGLDEKRLLKQVEEIALLNKSLAAKGKTFRILSGTECDILKDGRLDIADDVLAKLDVVGISIHSFFTLPRKEQTARVVRAMKNPHADILFHPTGRLIGKREACDLDMDVVIRVARETGTVLEVNAQPDRLDLKDEYVRRCVGKGVKMAIDSDAHDTPQFAFLSYGVTQARRGWATKHDIVNAWPLERMRQFLKP